MSRDRDHWDPIGDARVNRALRDAQLNAHNAQVLKRIEFETSVDEKPRQARGATAGGDERKLRGIPAIGRGVAGAIPGSSPHHGPATLTPSA